MLEPYGTLEQRMPLGRVKPAPGGPLGSYLSTVPACWPHCLDSSKAGSDRDYRLDFAGGLEFQFEQGSDSGALGRSQLASCWRDCLVTWCAYLSFTFFLS